MGKSNRRRRKKVGRFVMLEHQLMDSLAFRSLTGPALKLLLEVWKRHDGQNNGMISFGTREAAQLLCGNKNTAGRRFAELVEKGLLVVESKGAFSVKHRQATVWRLTMEQTMAGNRVVPATREYQRWRPGASTNGATAPAAGRG